MIERMREHLPSALELGRTLRKRALRRGSICFENSEMLGRWQLGCDIHYHPCSLYVGSSGAWEVEFEGDQGEHCTVILGSSAETIVDKLESLAEAEGWS